MFAQDERYPGSVGPVGRAGNVPTRTGGWALSQPQLDYSRCNRCLLCWIYCPDGSIQRTGADGEERLVIDYLYCKGCGICERECARGAIVMQGRE